VKLTLKSVQKLTDQISEFNFETPADASHAWAAGSHVELETSAGLRSYSLIRWPNENINHFRFAVKCEHSGAGGSQAMHTLRGGDVINAKNVRNNFELVDQTYPIILLAGGIGITPLISMAVELHEQDRLFQLHYAVRNAESAAYATELQQLFGDRFHLYLDDTNPIDLNGLITTNTDHAFYICGPLGMINAARSLAENTKIPASKIHVELFANTEIENENTPFEVEIASTGQIVSVAANQTIIEALEEAGVDVMFDCQRGDCGICATDVIAGAPDHRDVVLSEAERNSNRVMQICVSRALSERLVLDL
jgi:vanillate O-demethylase ferredoxin subunit